MNASTAAVRPPSPGEREGAIAFLHARWGTVVVSRGVVHALADLSMLVAVRKEVVGCLTFAREGDVIEIVTLDAFVESQGVGSALLRAALALGPKVWLVTTNDNLRAQGFYRSHGGTLVATYSGAVALSRKLKPGIPTHGHAGIPIEDELQYEWRTPSAA